MKKRITVPAEMVGKKVLMTVQGNGNIIDVKDKDGELVMSSIPGQEGTVLQKKIFNVQANSGLAMQNTRTRGYLIDGLKAEKAKDTGKAHELFNEYLNGTQISFGVLLPSSIADKLSQGMDIAAKIVRVDTENGSLLTIDPSTITIQEPEVLGTTSFNLDDFAAELETEEEKAARLKAEAKAAGKPKAGATK